MIVKEIGPKLHDRATKGEKLTNSEQALLAEWYTELDTGEIQLLGQTSEAIKEVDVTAVQRQIADALLQLESFTRHIQQLTSENDDLRQEVISLRRQVASLSNAKQLV